MSQYIRDKKQVMSKQFKEDLLKRNFNVQLSYFCLDSKGKLRTRAHLKKKYVV